jgi:hypothetical protein
MSMPLSLYIGAVHKQQYICFSCFSVKTMGNSEQELERGARKRSLSTEENKEQLNLESRRADRESNRTPVE